MTDQHPRPPGFDYDQPDPPETRCLTCNPDGVNRTGFVFIGYYGALTTSGFGRACLNKCHYGIKTKDD